MPYINGKCVNDFCDFKNMIGCWFEISPAQKKIFNYMVQLIRIENEVAVFFYKNTNYEVRFELDENTYKVYCLKVI